MPFTFDVSVARQTPDGIPFTEHVNDYVMLVSGSEKFYVQHGAIYRNGAEQVAAAQAPGWFWDAYSRITPSTRRLVGLRLPEDIAAETAAHAAALVDQFATLSPELQDRLRQAMGVQAPRMPVEAPKTSEQYTDQSMPLDALKSDPEAPQPKLWTCEQCDETLLLRKKGVHLAGHARAAKHAQKVSN